LLGQNHNWKWHKKNGGHWWVNKPGKLTPGNPRYQHIPSCSTSWPFSLVSWLHSLSGFIWWQNHSQELKKADLTWPKSGRKEILFSLKLEPKNSPIVKAWQGSCSSQSNDSVRGMRLTDWSGLICLPLLCTGGRVNPTQTKCTENREGVSLKRNLRYTAKQRGNGCCVALNQHMFTVIMWIF
jgi:hypothetical protein